MRLLLDTHVYLWCINDDPKLSNKAKELILNAAEVYVSSASIWEITIKTKIGKLEVNVDAAVTAIKSCGFIELPISCSHAAFVQQLPDHHHDPFDRILIAQAMSEPLRLLSADALLRKYSDFVELI